MASAEREAITGVWGQSPQRGPGAEPLVRRQGAKPPEAENFFVDVRPYRFRQISPFLMFGVKRRKMIFKHRQTTNIRAVMLSLVLVVLKDQISVLVPGLGLDGQVLGPGLGLEGAVLAKDSTKDQGQRQHR